MSGFMQQQTFTHTHREGDILLVGNVLAMLGRGDIAGAQRLLIQYHDNLILQSEPKLADYNPRVQQEVR